MRLLQSPSMASNSLSSFEFEVHGKVQGVFFRKNTKKQADSLNIVGWVMNTSQGTVMGCAQGHKESLDKLGNVWSSHSRGKCVGIALILTQSAGFTKYWLANKGSKNSRITRCDIQKERQLSKLEFTSFQVTYERPHT